MASHKVQSFVAMLDKEIGDVDEETYDLFSSPSRLQDLGMVDPTASSIDLTVHDRDLTIRQSPGLLQSRRNEGTTGAVLWRTTVAVAEWMARPENILFTSGVMGPDRSMLELGSGVAGLLAQVLAPRLRTFIATDQPHVLKMLRANIQSGKSVVDHNKSKASSRRSGEQDVRILSLDWEEDDARRQLRSHGLRDGVDALVACDCVFNDALIEPFVQTCVDICTLRRRDNDDNNINDHDDNDRPSGDSSSGAPPTLCIIAQHLRHADVFEQWLSRFIRDFHVWRLPDSWLGPTLQAGGEFVVHMGMLRKSSLNA
ncbi:MAG: hypothetical protein FE78DRAFT_231786 [Acidomyces sp. 'richmondensis']|nr:MAG: hypothetical protein FE78DRAFT_231786 [Acidomyces sp. 'richmondensis']